VASESIEQGAGQTFGAESFSSFVERKIASDHRRAEFVAAAEDLK